MPRTKYFHGCCAIFQKPSNTGSSLTQGLLRQANPSHDFPDCPYPNPRQWSQDPHLDPWPTSLPSPIIRSLVTVHLLPHLVTALTRLPTTRLLSSPTSQPKTQSSICTKEMSSNHSSLPPAEGGGRM